MPGTERTKKSTDAHVIFLWGNLVAYGAKKQPWVARSLWESELGGGTRAGGMAKHMLHILLGMGILVELPMPFYMDNKGLVQSLGNVTHVSSAKHIDIRIFWMKDDVARATSKNKTYTIRSTYTDTR
jgi:hypothetical protein